MIIKHIILSMAALIAVLPGSYASPYPWNIERPNGVELEGILDLDGNLTITSFGSSIICTVRREPILKREWMFTDEPPVYDWQEPLEHPFKYFAAPTGSMVRIENASSFDFDVSMMLHVRQRREIRHNDGLSFTFDETSLAWSYGETEIRTFR